MSGEEIREKIIANNKIIEAQASFFVINKETQKALQENEFLREICHHEYDDLGFCIYCDKGVD